ncbi:DUF2798 domain-containing protein [Acinetobacter sp. TY2]|uniref:DUF2798 domain-containing protein n=1 Tax=unclassified Acinetobacter TaxID=196816 RepID=UPI00391787FA
MSENRPMIVGNIPKLPAKYAMWIMPLFLSCLMSGMVSLINLILNVGLSGHFFKKWLSAWLISWVVAYPVVLIVLPLVRKLTGILVDMRD